MNNNNNIKQCRRCLLDLGFDQFGPHKKTKDKLQSWCNDCKKQYNLSRYFRIADKENERRRKYYKENK